jgi:hypothetical protein
MVSGYEMHANGGDIVLQNQMTMPYRLESLQRLKMTRNMC